MGPEFNCPKRPQSSETYGVAQDDSRGICCTGIKGALSVLIAISPYSSCLHFEQLEQLERPVTNSSSTGSRPRHPRARPLQLHPRRSGARRLHIFPTWSYLTLQLRPAIRNATHVCVTP